MSVIGRVRGGILHCARNERATQLGVGREHAVEANQMQPRTRHQRGEALHELQRRHDDVSGAILVGAVQLQHDIAGVIGFESFVGNGGAGDIAAQAFEFLTLIGVTAHRCMQAEAVRVDTAWLRGIRLSAGDRL